MLLNERRAVSNTDANDVVILYIKFQEFGKRVRVALFLRLKNETKLEMKDINHLLIMLC